jgi:hypothetical protein
VGSPKHRCASRLGRTTGSRSVIVAVIDDGFEETNPQLAPNLWTNPDESGVHGWNFEKDDNNPTPLAGDAHGTRMAGLIGAKGNDGVGITGVDWNVSLMNLDYNFSGSANRLAAVKFAGSHGAQVVNMSVSGDYIDQAEAEAIASYPNTLFVTAAGEEGINNQDTNPEYPCNYPNENVICVTDINEQDELEANYGETSVDIGAPGTNILTTNLGGGYYYGNGTSDATAIVSGAAALVDSAMPGHTGAWVKQRLMSTGDPDPALARTVCGCRLDVGNALANLPPEYTLEVSESGSGQGAVTSTPDRIDCDPTCSGKFDEKITVTLYAAPTAHSTFVGWTGCTAEPSHTECEVEMTEATKVGAEFAAIPQQTLEVSVAGLGTVTSSPAGISGCTEGGGTCSAGFNENSTVILSAHPQAHNRLAGWTGCAAEPSPTECEVTIGATAASVGSQFEPITHILSVDVNGSGSVGASSGTISGCTSSGGTSCSGTYDEASEVTLTATPNAHQKFKEWSGREASGCGTTTTCKVTTPDSDASVTATFEPITHTLSVDVNGSGSVTCNGATCASSYEEGTAVTLATRAEYGSAFAGWSGTNCSGMGSCVVTIEADTTITATFTQNLPLTAEEKVKAPTVAQNPPAPPEEGMVTAPTSAIVSGGKTIIELRCSGGPCNGKLRLTARVKQGKKAKNMVIGQASYKIAAGDSVTLEVKLSGPADKLIKQGNTIEVKLSGGPGLKGTLKLGGTKNHPPLHRTPEQDPGRGLRSGER